MIYLNAINEVIVEVNEKGLYEQWREEAVALAEKLGIETNLSSEQIRFVP